MPKQLTPRAALVQIKQDINKFLLENRRGFTNMGTALNLLYRSRAIIRRALKSKKAPSGK